jgi:hypothetical protein
MIQIHIYETKRYKEVQERIKGDTKIISLRLAARLIFWLQKIPKLWRHLF